MILEGICMPFIWIIEGLISILPVLTYIPTSIADTISLLMKAMQFFPNDVWIMVLGNVIFWTTIHLLVGLIKFILRIYSNYGWGVKLKKNIIFNKYYRKLRKDPFENLDIEEFMDVFSKFKKLKFDYRLLKICNFLESLHIFKIEIPILRFLTMLLDFFRWKIYDLLYSIINGKVFKPYRFNYILWKTRWWKNCFYG